MEYFDIVDELGNPTGEKVERKEAHAKGICHRTAHIWVARTENGKKQVLLQIRAWNKDSFPGCYDTSSAGHIQAGDEPLVSAQRELAEELGIQASEEELKFAGTFRLQYQEEFHGELFWDNEVAFVYIYDQPVNIEELVLQEEELAGAEWFDLEYVESQLQAKNPEFCVPEGGFFIAKNAI